MMQQICRTCLATSDELIPIFCNDYYIHNLPAKLLETMNIKVYEEDNLPKLMCKKCIFLVDTLHCFKNQCVAAEIKLRKNLKQFRVGDVGALIIDDENLEEHHPNQNRDGATSSEEDYHIEYISEEARVQVENAKKRNRRAKRRRKRRSVIGVELLESLPSLSKKIRPLNFSKLPSHQQSTNGDLDEDTNLSESDDRSSILVASGSKMYISGSIRQKRLQTANTPEQFSSSDTKTAGYSERSSNMRSTKRSDRKSSHHQFSRIPRQISYQEDEYNDETENKNGENIKKQMRLIEHDPLIRINRIDGGGNGIASRAGLIEMKEANENLPESFNPQNTAMKISKSNSKSAYHFRLRMLVESFVLNMPDICAICLQQFGSYLDVLKHKICSHMSSEQEYYFCPVCHDKFFSSSDLIVHLDGHANIQSFICTICSTNFYTDETLRKHLVTHADVSGLKCKTCLERFKEMRDLSEHMKGHIPEEHLNCILCNTGFPDKEDLQYHLIDQHKIRREHIPPSERRGTEGEREGWILAGVEDHFGGQFSFSCPYCQLLLKSQDTLRNHMYKEHEHIRCQRRSSGNFQKMSDNLNERTSHGQLGSQLYIENGMQSQMIKTQQPPNSNSKRLKNSMEHHSEDNILQSWKDEGKRFRCRICHEILNSRSAYSDHVRGSHPSNEVLREFVDPSDREVKGSI